MEGAGGIALVSGFIALPAIRVRLHLLAVPESQERSGQ